MKKLNCGNTNSRVWTGVVILAVGVVFLLKNVGLNIPDWIISWHTLLIVFGLLIGYKINFRGVAWLIMMLIGIVLTLEQVIVFDLSKYYYAIAFMVVGLCIIFKPKSAVRLKGRNRWKEKWERKMREKYSDFESLKMDASFGDDFAEVNKNDVLESVNIFGGSHQNLYSKNFKGGDVVAVFGGSDINLTQTDFEGVVKLEIVAVFGGVKIVIPPGWEVRSEIVAIFGGIDDKRTVNGINTEPRKILIIDGVALFGGVDIRSF